MTYAPIGKKAEKHIDEILGLVMVNLRLEKTVYQKLAKKADKKGMITKAYIRKVLFDKVNKKSKSESKNKEQKSDYHNITKRKMSFKENMEFKRLGEEIEQLEKKQKILEEELCSGTLSVDELTEKSKRLPVIKDELDEKGMRWLELSELN